MLQQKEIFGVIYQLVDPRQSGQEIQEKFPNLKANTDIIPGVYEGGFTLWECTVQLLKYLDENNINFKSKDVIDVGCGMGLLGILALVKNAHTVCFQDYNFETYSTVLQHQLQLNNSKILNIQNRWNFIAGDWVDIIDSQEICRSINNTIIKNNFDIALASEVIYREENYQKIIYFLQNTLKLNAYYFGVGGSVQGFKDLLESNDQMKLKEEIVLNDKKSNKRVILIIERVK